MSQPLPLRQKIYWPDNTEYFLTTSTFLHYPYFRESTQKQLVLNKIKEIEKVLGIPIPVFSIAINHFHLKFYLKDGKLMTQLKNMLHSGISREYRKVCQVPYKEFWQSTKVLYLRDEEASWKVTGYIIGNLLKHREVSTFNELKQNPFSSYRQITDEFGDEAARNLVYSVINVDESTDGEVVMSDLDKSKLPWAVKPPPWA